MVFNNTYDVFNVNFRNTFYQARKPWAFLI